VHAALFDFRAHCPQTKILIFQGAHIKAIITGWEEMKEGVKIEEWEKAGK